MKILFPITASEGQDPIFFCYGLIQASKGGGQIFKPGALAEDSTLCLTQVSSHRPLKLENSSIMSAGRLIVILLMWYEKL